MKIVDEKGRLFGKINIIDLVIIIFLASFIPLGYFSYKVIAMKSINEDNVQFRLLRVQLKLESLIPEVVKEIKEGDMERDSDGNIIARMEKILSNKPSGIIVRSDDKLTAGMMAHPFERDMLVSLYILCVKKDRNLYYKDCIIKIGNQIGFSTDIYNVAGLIIAIEPIIKGKNAR